MAGYMKVDDLREDLGRKPENRKQVISFFLEPGSISSRAFPAILVSNMFGKIVSVTTG